MKILGRLFCSVMITLAALADEPVAIKTLPKRPLIEKARNENRLNFDFFIENKTGEAIDVTTIELTILDPSDRMITQKRLAQNGQSIATIPNRRLDPGKTIVVYNPFVAFELDFPLERLRYEFVFSTATEDDKYKTTIVVEPRSFSPKTRLVLPVGGRTFIHDGHDVLSHHRRLDITGEMTTALGITSNFTRYAYDFCVTDEKGNFYKGEGSKNSDWFGFGVPIYAPGDGVVISAEGGVEDNRKNNPVPMDREAVMKNIHRIGGNYLLIDHRNGEYSFLAHLKKDTLRVKVGDVVKAGQQVGEMGMSGDAYLVHLHYQLQSDNYLGEGLPSYFENFRLFTGSKWTPIKRGQVDTGDIVESTSKYF